jgi:hypothetical protein
MTAQIVLQGDRPTSVVLKIPSQSSRRVTARRRPEGPRKAEVWSRAVYEPVMSRYTGPRLRVIRRLGYLPGLSRKSVKSPYLPGQHHRDALAHCDPSRRWVRRGKRRKSAYARRLEHKQRVRFNYGLTERQMKRCFLRARRKGIGLDQLLEMRLDSVVFSLGMAPTLVSARQMVTHGLVRTRRKGSGWHPRVTTEVSLSGARWADYARKFPFCRISVPCYECAPGEDIRGTKERKRNENEGTPEDKSSWARRYRNIAASRRRVHKKMPQRLAPGSM